MANLQELCRERERLAKCITFKGDGLQNPDFATFTTSAGPVERDQVVTHTHLVDLGMAIPNHTMPEESISADELRERLNLRNPNGREGIFDRIGRLAEERAISDRIVMSRPSFLTRCREVLIRRKPSCERDEWYEGLCWYDPERNSDVVSIVPLNLILMVARELLCFVRHPGHSLLWLRLRACPVAFAEGWRLAEREGPLMRWLRRAA